MEVTRLTFDWTAAPLQKGQRLFYSLIRPFANVLFSNLSTSTSASSSHSLEILAHRHTPSSTTPSLLDQRETSGQLNLDAIAS